MRAVKVLVSMQQGSGRGRGSACAELTVKHIEDRVAGPDLRRLFEQLKLILCLFLDLAAPWTHRIVRQNRRGWQFEENEITCCEGAELPDELVDDVPKPLGWEFNGHRAV